MCSLSKEQSILSRETIQNEFLSELFPFFDCRLFILYQTPHSQAMAPACGALVTFPSILQGISGKILLTTLPPHSYVPLARYPFAR